MRSDLVDLRRKARHLRRKMRDIKYWRQWWKDPRFQHFNDRLSVVCNRIREIEDAE